MKKTSRMFAAAILFFMMSCNNGGDAKKDKDSTTQAAAKDTMAVFKPFITMLVKHKVKDFAAWEKGYLAHDSVRKAFGIIDYVYGRGLDDSNMVIVINKVTDLQKAKDFAASPNLKEAMQKAGVVGMPTISYGNVVKLDPTKVDQMNRSMVTIKVKDFDAWEKVFQTDKDKRMEAGTIDRAISRNVDDPNSLSLVFVINDIAKSKGFGNNPELKKKMEEAGVIGKPDVFYYKIISLKQ